MDIYTHQPSGKTYRYSLDELLGALGLADADTPVGFIASFRLDYAQRVLDEAGPIHCSNKPIHKLCASCRDEYETYQEAAHSDFKPKVRGSRRNK